MSAMTAIGEIGIETGGRSYLLRPSLFSMTQIGTPAEIVQTCALLMAEEPENPNLLRAFRRERFDRALTVWYACAGDQDLGELIGGLAPAPVAKEDLFSRPFSLVELQRLNRRPRYVAGLLPMADIVALARTLIRHGVMGDAAPSKDAAPKPSEYMSEFKAMDYAATAVAHLGYSEREAWNMTMTSFLAAMRSKFPPAEKGAEPPKPHTAEEYDAVMERLKKINELRAGKK